MGGKIKGPFYGQVVYSYYLGTLLKVDEECELSVLILSPLYPGKPCQSVIALFTHWVHISQNSSDQGVPGSHYHSIRVDTYFYVSFITQK